MPLLDSRMRNAGRIMVSFITTLTILGFFPMSSRAATAAEGHCVLGCPICVGKTEYECYRVAVYQKCAPQQKCVKESVWSFRGEQLSVVMKCEDVGQCHQSDDEQCLPDGDRLSCIECASAKPADDCENFAVEVRWMFPVIAVVTLLIAVVCFTMKSKRRRRNCPDKCVSLCIGHLNYMNADNTTTTKRCRANYQRSVMLP